MPSTIRKIKGVDVKQGMSSDGECEPPPEKRARAEAQGQEASPAAGQCVRSRPCKEIVGVPEVGLSAYEIMIQRNIAKKHKYLDSLGIFKFKEELSMIQPHSKKPTNRGIARSLPSPSQLVEVRRSLRQQKLTTNGQNLPSVANSTHLQESQNPPMPPPGPAGVVKYCRTQDREELEWFMHSVKNAVTRGKEAVAENNTVWAGKISSVVKVMKKMVVKEEWVVKAIPDRIFTIQVHPSLTKILVLMGGKWGQLGMWEVGRDDKSSGAHFFSPHSRPINCLTVDPAQPSQVYTSSYDASVRTTNLETGVVCQVYRHVPENETNQWVSWHTHADQHSLLVAASHGKIVHVDMREQLRKRPRVFKVHDGCNVKVVTQHPANYHYFASAARNGKVCLWDARKMRDGNPVAECPHPRVVCGLEFSPVTGNSLITTSMDDHLRFISCDLSQLKEKVKIHHNNQTGRWLTNFKARFLPGREDLVVVGSLAYPRRVEVWGSDGNLYHEFLGENLGSVASVVAFHPSRPVLAGANSSGRVHVFM